jgi:hypothetical protein
VLPPAAAAAAAAGENPSKLVVGGRSLPHCSQVLAEAQLWCHFTKTHAALQRTAVDIVAVELANGHGSILVRVHLDESETAVRLEARLGNVAKVLEQRDQVVLSGVRGEVADVAGSLPLRSLCEDSVVRLDALSGELVVLAKGTRRGNTHLGHSLLLGERRLALLVGPVAADGARAQPLAVHRGQGLVGLGAVAEGNKAVATRAAGLHVPHDAGLGYTAKGGEGLEEHFVVDFVGEIANKDVEVARGVLLAGRV